MIEPQEKRLKYQWPAWFGYDENGDLFQGQMHDLSKSSATVTIDANHHPVIGSNIIIRFSYPISEKPFFNVGRYYQWATVLQVESNATGTKNNMHLSLHHPLKQSLPIEYCNVLAMQSI